MRINVEKEIQHITKWIKNYFIMNGPDCNAIIGISGGKDSTVAAALLVEALGPDRVIGVLMPNGEQNDIFDAREVCTHLGIRSHEVNISEICEAFYGTLGYEECVGNSQIATNTPARIRMTVLYALAAIYHGRVCCTSNASEAYIGYTTKFGDNAGDFAILKDYTVSEIYDLGVALGLPEHLVYKAPADGMTGKSDEDVLGFTYATLDWMLLEGEEPRKYSTYQKIIERHNRNLHKNKSIPYVRRTTGGYLYDPLSPWNEGIEF